METKYDKRYYNRNMFDTECETCSDKIRQGETIITEYYDKLGYNINVLEAYKLGPLGHSWKYFCVLCKPNI